MPLIDYTFFIGELNIPNVDKPDVLEELNMFIAKYEPKFLSELLGYPLYKAFKSGLLESVVDQKWLDLLGGAEYQYHGSTVYFPGLVEGAGLGASSLIGYTYKQPQLITFGLNSLPNGVASVIMDGTGGKPDYRNQTLVIEKVGFGTQEEGVNYTFNKVTGLWTLLGGQIFDDQEKYFVQFELTPVTSANAVATEKKSMIANYIYYWWMRNKVTQSTGVGEAAAKPENAQRVSPIGKMTRAWNEMTEATNSFLSFIESDLTFYPDWSRSNVFKGCMRKDIYCPINTFNL